MARERERERGGRRASGVPDPMRGEGLEQPQPPIRIMGLFSEAAMEAGESWPPRDFFFCLTPVEMSWVSSSSESPSEGGRVRR
jgi:hypothetical protein